MTTAPTQTSATFASPKLLHTLAALLEAPRTFWSETQPHVGGPRRKTLLVEVSNVENVSVPGDLKTVLDRFTAAGYRVIALAGRKLQEWYTAEELRDSNRFVCRTTCMLGQNFFGRLS